MEMMRVVCVLSSPGCRYALWNDKVESRHLLAWPKLHVMTESSKGLKNFTVHYVFLLLIREKGLVAYQEKRTADVLCRSCSLVFQMVNHRSQIHLAQTGDDDRSQT